MAASGAIFITSSRCSGQESSQTIISMCDASEMSVIASHSLPITINDQELGRIIIVIGVIIGCLYTGSSRQLSLKLSWVQMRLLIESTDLSS